MTRLSSIRTAVLLAGTMILSLWPGSSVSATEPAASTSDTSNGLRLLEEMQTVITELAEAAKPSVVSLFPISASGKGREFPQERIPNAPGSGSGVIVDSEGHIITNNHVVGDAAEVEVRLSDKTKFTAQVIGKDPDTDLALLKITSDRPLPFAQLGDSADREGWPMGARRG